MTIQENYQRTEIRRIREWNAYVLKFRKEEKGKK